MLQARALLTTTNDVVYIFDNVFDTFEQAHYRLWLERAEYRFSIPGADIIEDRQQRALSCFLNDEQALALNIFRSPAFLTHFDKMLAGRTRKRVWCNLTTYMTDCHYHVDWHENSDGLTWLYYANTTWEKNWGGETIICNRADEPELAVACKPNRVLVFPSRLNHRVANLSRHAPPHRFVVVAIYGERAEPKDHVEMVEP